MPLDEMTGRPLRQRVPQEKPLLQQIPEPKPLLQKMGGERKAMLQKAGDYVKTPSVHANFRALMRGKSSNRGGGKGRNR